LRETAARAPFAEYREVSVRIGARCRRVVVADTNARREQGLRGATGLGPYAGMLFVNSADSRAAFTMSGVSTALDIAWFAADGSRVDATRMRPCPRAVACPIYSARAAYRFALETPAGTSARVTVSPCV
jgi:uncharacterized protein